MSTVSYLYDPGTTVTVLLPGNCPGTYSVNQALINRVEIKISHATPSPIISINYVVTITTNNTVVSVPETDVFLDNTTAVAEAVIRYQNIFN